MNSGLRSHQQRDHTQTGPRFKVSSERPNKRGIDLAIPGLVVWRVIHYSAAAPRITSGRKKGDDEGCGIIALTENRRFFFVFFLGGGGEGGGRGDFIAYHLIHEV